MHLGRREFVVGAASAGVLGLKLFRVGAEPPPETTTLRLVRTASICQATQYVAEELLRAEGFTEVQFLAKPTPGEIGKALASGEADINLHFAGPLIIGLEAGEPIVILAGGHIGCFELFGPDRIRAIRDLKGRSLQCPASTLPRTSS